MATFEIEYPKDALVIATAAPRAQPAMARRLMHAAAADAAGPVPRSALTIPISPGTAITDAVLFEDAADPQRKRYIPRYRVRTEIVSGRQQFEISFEQDPHGFRLTVHLDHDRAPELGEAGREAAPLDGPYHVILAFTPRSIGGASAAEKQLTFQEVTVTPTGLRATLRVSDLLERDSVYQALTEPDRRAALTVHRSLSIAIPAGQELIRQLADKARALAVQASALRASVPGPVSASANSILGEMFSSVDRFKEKAEQLEKTGSTKPLVEGMALHLWSITHASHNPFLSFAIGAHIDPIEGAAKELAALVKQLEAYVDRYVSTPVTLPIVVTPVPFVFSPELHGYAYADLAAPAGGLLSREVKRGGQWLRYYQDWTRRNRFYYLPDRFELKPAPAPRQVQMTVERASADQYLIQYTAVPVVVTSRFDEDLQQLQRFLPPGDAKVEFAPLVVENPAFFLRVPRSNTPALWERQRRPDVLGRLDGTLQDGLVVSGVDLASLVNAMFSPSNNFFTGEIEFKIGNFATEVIPFDGHVNGGSREAIWDAIFDQKLTAETMSIKINTAPATLTQAGVSVVHVHFEAGATVELTPANPGATVALRTPIRAFVLGTADERTYRYRVTLVYADGRPEVSIPNEAGWLASTDTILRPPLTA